MKYLLPLLLMGSVLLLGLKGPGDEHRDPVPPGIIVAHSSHCAGCHGYDPTGIAMTDAQGNDINIYDDWRISMMSLSARDPFWRATLRHEVNLFPGAQAEIEQTCLRCHAPLGTQQHIYDDEEYSYAAMLKDSLGLDGVSCAACHQQPPETFGTSNSGHITVNYDRELYGPYPNPFEGPMQLYVGFYPVYSDLMYSSGLCAGCHTLITGTLDADGEPTGDMFVEQATYHEWLNSSYSSQGVECQNCHLPLMPDSVILANDLKDLEKRSPFGLHQFHGANTAMLSLIRAHRDTVGLPDTIPESAWEQSIAENRESLGDAADIDITSFEVFDDTLSVQLTVTNNAGHKMPSGYPSRVAWLQVVLLDELSGDTIYANGMLDGDGNIAGRDLPYEPHHEISRSEDDVQIYEMVMSDLTGTLTTRLNAAYRPLKDNRLLPAGFRRNHAVYDTVAIWGAALHDPDYGTFSELGTDHIDYRIPLHSYDGLADLRVMLRYHTFPSRWMQDLFESEQIPEVAAFKQMYDGYETFTELIDSTGVEGLSLQVSEVVDADDPVITIFPNPVNRGNTIAFAGDAITTDGDTRYQLFNTMGQCVIAGAFQKKIEIDDRFLPGLYYLVISASEKRIAMRKIIVQ